MSEPAPNSELLRSLGRLVRGLSALFWGLPCGLVVCVQTAKTDTLRSFDGVLPVVVTGWVCFGLWQIGGFQKQERIWQSTLHRSKLLALVNFGLSPFLHWWNQIPSEPFFTAIVTIMAVSGLVFLANLNLVIQRLSAMLPDEGLREEARHFTKLNRVLVLMIVLVGLVLGVLTRFPFLLPAPEGFQIVLAPSSMWLMVFLVLLPLAMTMALLWKIKEAILESVFGGPGRLNH